jgi:hypothetical protein
MARQKTRNSSHEVFTAKVANGTFRSMSVSASMAAIGDHADIPPWRPDGIVMRNTAYREAARQLGTAGSPGSLKHGASFSLTGRVQSSLSGTRAVSAVEACRVEFG